MRSSAIAPVRSRKRTDLYKLLARYQLTPEGFKR